jgi:hypothetical protein
MQNETLAADGGARSRLRTASMLLAMTLAFTALVLLLQNPADAAPVAQFDVAALIRSIVCPILNSLVAAFSGFFGGFIVPIIQQLQIAFGCTGISG